MTKAIIMINVIITLLLMAAKITFKNTDYKHLTIFNTDYSVVNMVVPEGKKKFWE
jgi:hypothetical protein